MEPLEGARWSNEEQDAMYGIALDNCDVTDEPMMISDDNVDTTVTNPDARDVEVNRVFKNKEVLKLSMAFYAMQQMFEFMVLRSDKKEYVVRCSNDTCNWVCRSSKLGKTDLFKIRYIHEGHTCGLNIVLGSHRQVSTAVVSSCIKYKFKSNRTTYTPNDICNDMLHTYGVSLNYVKAWRSREKTLKLIRGDPAESFQHVPGFLHMLERNNPGSVTGLEIDSGNRFKYCFMALGASIRGWMQCRPIVVVDGTYLKGQYGGTLFTACTQDANNRIFILAFGIGDSENDNSWKWFLEHLKKTYGTREGLCFVSDRHDSIRKGIENVYPGTCHGICSYHLLQNLKKHYGKSGHNITEPYNYAVRAYTLSEFEYQMKQLDAVDEAIRGYLSEVGYEKWSRFHMPENRYSTMTSNIVESVNAVTKSAKNFPIVSLLESLRQTVQNWFCKNRDSAHGTFTKLSSKYEKLLRKSSIELRSLRVSPSNHAMYSVKDENTSFVVDIEQRKCTCRMIQVDQMPCPHALAVIAFTKRDPYEYCSYYYTCNAYKATYQGSVFPIGNPIEWKLPSEITEVVVLPPNQKRSSGRPSEKRKRSAREGKPKMKCGRCGRRGHKRRSCTSLFPISQKSGGRQKNNYFC